MLLLLSLRVLQHVDALGCESIVAIASIDLLSSTILERESFVIDIHGGVEASDEDSITEEILPRLPVKSVLRFKCVCKSFQTLISSPEFIHRRLRDSLSSEDNRLLVLVHNGYGTNSFNLDAPEFPAVHLPIPRSTQEPGFFIVGSCNGLVCLSTPFSSLIVCNPCTGSYKEIYNFCVPGCFAVYGFGCDDVNDDYKVVKLTSHKFHYGSRFMTRRMVEVYSLKLDC